MKNQIFVLYVFLFAAQLGHSETVAGSSVTVDSGSIRQISDTKDLKTKARKRLYPGGRDEESLRVQTQLNSIQRKMGPAQEAPEAAPAGDPSND